MTLVEISIALLIAALMVGVALPSIEAFAGVRAREEAGRIAGAIRYMFGASALSGKACRLVFDLDERAWWAECTEARFTVEREKERSRGGGRVEEKPEAPKEARDEVEALKQRIEKKAEFSAFTAEEVPRRTLPTGANVEVWVAHQREKYVKGRAFLYFFPQGNTERARVWVSSDHGDVYTLTVSALNGRVRVVDQELEVPKD